MMAEAAREQLRGKFATAATLAGRPGCDRAYFLRHVDAILDQFIDWEMCATEWDAQQWGLDPDNWMKKECAEIRRRGGCGKPVAEAR